MLRGHFGLRGRCSGAARRRAAGHLWGVAGVFGGVNLFSCRIVVGHPRVSLVSPQNRTTNPPRSPVPHMVPESVPRPPVALRHILVQIAYPGSARNAAGRPKTAAIDPARFLVPPTVLESAARPPKSPRDPSYSKSRLRPPRGTVRQKKEKISPVRLLPRRLFHLGAHGSTSYVAARSL